ncbi:MAG: hypothetical protein K2X69_13050 [Silvanigrellaceae bacterium]|nr:hypothetical protein [Silvanigrellaceae bacterium]
MIKKINYYLLIILISNNAFAENVITKGSGAIESDANVVSWISLINWALTAGGGVYASVLGYGALKHVKHGEYGSGINGLSAAALAGGITYFVHTYLAK